MSSLLHNNSTNGNSTTSNGTHPVPAIVVELKNVLLAIESSRAYGRGCLRGIASYMRAHSKWHLIHWERESSESLSGYVQRWRDEGKTYDGAICRLDSQEDAEVIAALGLPTVDLRGSRYVPGGAVLDTDPVATAALAAEHLLERGFRHLTFCGFPGLAFSRQRGRAFVEFLRERSIEPLPEIAPTNSTNGHPGNGRLHERNGDSQVERMIPWLRELPKPVGVMACNDDRGRQVIHACGLAGLKVPEEVAVVGVDNDEVICELSDPPLSSVAPDTLRLGYEGASLLDRMMRRGQPPPKETILIRPKGVFTRLSSDFLAVGDRDFAAALHFIRENACSGINVGDVVNRCQISRSTLERRFVKYLGIGPKECILRTRFERVKTLLRETDYELFQVARLTGFRTTAHLVSSFKSHTGETPGQYRRDVKAELLPGRRANSA